MKSALLLAWILLMGIVALGSLYTVSETEQVVITEFGRPVGGVVATPGLHWKTPFVQDVHRFDKRWLEYDGDPNEIPTRDKKYIWVDTYARWRIVDPLLFYQAVSDEIGGQSRLDDIVDGQTRNAIASFDLIEAVRSTNRPFEITEELQGIGSEEARANIATGRSQIEKIILEKAAKITPQFGIELVDVRIKRLNYVESVQQKVFERMTSERKRIAERSRSEGQGRAAEILGEKEREVRAATSNGYKQAQEIKGKADGQAIAITAKAFSRDPDLYQFLKSLETLGATVDKDTWMVLSTDSEVLRYLKSPAPR
ncbi:MAG TPA: protease modulator HflC [Candidatus Polarisedimenticolia bacterium]|jgi:membrane protease subunit HflC|nr:protease modulator HflC [Candidatus Polarisedimenticolia bacterium]